MESFHVGMEVRLRNLEGQNWDLNACVGIITARIGKQYTVDINYGEHSLTVLKRNLVAHDGKQRPHFEFLSRQVWATSFSPTPALCQEILVQSYTRRAIAPKNDKSLGELKNYCKLRAISFSKKDNIPEMIQLIEDYLTAEQERLIRKHKYFHICFQCGGISHWNDLETLPLIILRGAEEMVKPYPFGQNINVNMNTWHWNHQCVMCHERLLNLKKVKLKIKCPLNHEGGKFCEPCGSQSLKSIDELIWHCWSFHKVHMDTYGMRFLSKALNDMREQLKKNKKACKKIGKRSRSWRMQCIGCGEWEGITRFLSCKGCGSRYCGSQCAKNDWKYHKKHCSHS